MFLDLRLLSWFGVEELEVEFAAEMAVVVVADDEVRWDEMLDNLSLVLETIELIEIEVGVEWW